MPWIELRQREFTIRLPHRAFSIWPHKCCSLLIHISTKKGATQLEDLSYTLLSPLLLLCPRNTAPDPSALWMVLSACMCTVRACRQKHILFTHIADTRAEESSEPAAEIQVALDHFTMVYFSICLSSFLMFFFFLGGYLHGIFFTLSHLCLLFCFSFFTLFVFIVWCFHCLICFEPIEVFEMLACLHACSEPIW